MRRFIISLLALLLLMVSFGVIFFSSAIYDAVDNMGTQIFFFQPSNLSSHRMNTPITPEALGETGTIEQLLSRFISEYFYVIPDKGDIERRKLSTGILKIISSSNVFNQWLSNEVPRISEMAGQNMLRTAQIVYPVLRPTGGDKYWTVNYELRTWKNPNDIEAGFEVTRGTMYIDILFGGFGIRQSILDSKNTIDDRSAVRKWLDDGNDPISLFKFRIEEIQYQ